MDLISRQAAIEAVMNHYRVGDKSQNEEMDWCAEMLSGLPTAEPDATMCWGCNYPNMPDAEKRGEWKVLCHGQQDNGLYVFSYTCSECGFHGDNTNYCPNCGARMEE